MRVCVDSSTCTGSYSGTGVYTAGLIKSLDDIGLVRQLELIGYKTQSSQHKLIHWDLHANRPNLQADASFFPNYFLPDCWSIPSVVNIHDLSFITHRHFYSGKMWMFYQWRIRHTIRNASHILTVSEASRKALYHHLPEIKQPVTVIPPGSRLGRQHYPTDTDSPYLLYVGNIEPKKNILALIDSFIRAGLKGMKLRLAGKIHASRRYRNTFMKMIHQYPQVEYLGYVDVTTLSELMDLCSGLVKLSHVEGFGLPVREAIQKNKPVMISDDPALTELGRGEVFRSRAEDPDQMVKDFRKFGEFIRSGETVNYSKRPGWKYFKTRLTELLSALQNRYTPAIPIIPTVSGRIQHAILEIVTYSSVFRAPVAIPRLYELLHKVSCTYGQFETELDELLAKHPRLIYTDGEYVWMKGVNSPEYHLRHAVNPNREFLIRHHRIVRLLSRLPWIRGMYYSGGSVHGSALNGRDIDLFVVTRSGRVWLTYTLMRILSHLTNHQTRICTNYLVDEHAITISYQRDFYTAFQIAHLQPVDTSRAYPDVRALNQWISEIFPNLHIPEPPESQPKKKTGFMGFINIVVMHLWRIRWNKKGYRSLEGGMLWDAHRIKLHSKDNRPRVYQRYRKIMRWVKAQIKLGRKVPADRGETA